MRYPKQSLEFQKQLDLVTNRGLIVNDTARALRWLSRVSYYRLSAYFLPFKYPGTDSFRVGAEFSQIAELYKFDGRLRLLTLQAIERSEIALRTALTYHIALNYGPFGHVDAGNFAPEFEHARFMQELSDEESRSREVFVTHYRNKYTSELHLPVWMATELISFGTISKMFKFLRPDIQKAIASEYGVPGDIFKTWLHSLSYVRNTCAHHKRFWNRQLAISPRFPRQWQYSVPGNNKVYSVMVILQHMMNIICPACRWKQRVVQLLDSLPGIYLGHMGFPGNWKTIPPWS